MMNTHSRFERSLSSEARNRRRFIAALTTTAIGLAGFPLPFPSVKTSLRKKQQATQVGHSLREVLQTCLQVNDFLKIVHKLFRTNRPQRHLPFHAGK